MCVTRVLLKSFDIPGLIHLKPARSSPDIAEPCARIRACEYIHVSNKARNHSGGFLKCWPPGSEREMAVFALAYSGSCWKRGCSATLRRLWAD
ncbi:hypothetical protein M3J09_005198 [Ascochyta lentis]